MKRRIKKKICSLLLVFSMVLCGMGGSFTIAQAKVSTVALSVKAKKLTVGKKYQLKLKKARSIKIRKKVFSKKGKAVHINKKGKITAKKKGKAIVYCNVKYQRKGSEKIYKKKLKCKITVTAKQSNNGAGSSGTAYTALPQSSTAPDASVSGATGQPSGQPSLEPGKATPVPTQFPTKPGTNTAFEFVHNMGLGINLGNTMEAYHAGASTTAQLETTWGQPITTQAMISGMKKAGFRSLRIPVSWSSMMSGDGTYTIDSRLLKRVEEIVQYAFQEDMYVIINIHWDGQWWGQFGDKDSSVREKAWARYEAFWTQISEYYRDYSDHLIFESANEELGERLNDDWTDISSYDKPGTLTEDERYQTVHAINQKFVEIVRASGGNNASRFLLIAGYNTDIAKTCDSRYIMPEDTIADHLLISVHYYSPEDYCLVENEDNSWGYAASWGTDADKAAMRAGLSAMKHNFTDRGIPVVIGEYGVSDTKFADGSFGRKEGRDLFFQTLCDYALSNGMCPVLWNTDNVYDKSSCKIKNETEAAGYLALEKKAAEAESYVPPEFTGTQQWSGILKNDRYNQFVTMADDNAAFNVSANGGCFTLSDVDWDLYQNPLVKLTSSGLSGSCYCQFATQYADEGGWPYIKEADLGSGTWDFGKEMVIDLSEKGLSGRQNIYFSLNGEQNFEGNISIQITEK